MVMSLNEKFTALADEVRELSGTNTSKGIDDMTSDLNSVNTAINEQDNLLAQLFTVIDSLPAAGSPETRPTLFPPTISFNDTTTVLTVKDNSNGNFAVDYDLYVNDEFIATLASKSEALKDYIEHTETIELKVQARADCFNSSTYTPSIIWVKYNADGTPGLAYTISSGGTHATCTGLGSATDSEIEIASTVDGVPVTRTESMAFQKTYITKLTIGQNITSIGDQCFYQCTNLKNVIFSPNPINCGNRSFMGCTSLESITVYPDISKLDVFYNCGNLTNVTLLGNCSQYYNYFGTDFLGRCLKLKRFDISALTSTLTLKAISDISGDNADLQIRVHPTLIDYYKSATNWAALADKIVTEFTNEI